MINTDLFLRFGTAMLIGILIGIQREFAYGSAGKGLFAGVRTYSLMGLFGATAALLSELFGSFWIFISLVLLLGVMVIVAYFITATERDEIGLTSEVAALITILIGGVCYLHSIEFAVALGVITTVILASKWRLRQFVQGITRQDIIATLQFAVITAIILPILPNRTFGSPPFNVLNPFQIWEIVIFISGINFLGYILIKIAGPKRGLGLSGILGGLASSTAATMSFSQRSKRVQDLDKPFAVAIITSWIIMFIRVMIEVAVVNPRLLPLVWPTLVAMGIVGVVYALYLYFSQSAIDEEELKLSNPFELGPAIQFGLIFALILLLTKTAEIYFGAQGILITSFFAGLADVDAITLSIADLTRVGGTVSLATGRSAVILAALANTISKGVLVVVLGSRALLRYVWPAIALLLSVGLVFMLVF